jgi:DNA-binding CsgD family transcriptional regulator
LIQNRSLRKIKNRDIPYFNYNNMKKRSCLLFTVLLLSVNHKLSSQPGITGQIKIDTAIWAPTAYLSLIPDFDELNTMSNEMIIDKTNIDKSGNFHFNTQYLPEQDNFFRIHISKKNDPPASLIIGGKDENHFFLIANNKSTVTIRDTCSSNFIRGIIIEGYYPNRLLRQIDETASYLDTTSFAGSPVKTELIKSAIFDKLRFYADTCSNPLVGLYALYKSKFEKNYPVNQQYYNNFLTKWKKEQSSYFIEFRKKIPKSEDNRAKFPFLISAIFLIIGFLVCLAYFRFSKKDQNLLRDLSVQERKIFAMIMEGKSNKEISDTLAIGLSTVKSHVNNIYSKLGINSRKDALNLNLDKKNNGT